MAPPLFERLLAWLPPGSRIVFSGLGEPLLNPHIAGFVKALKERNHTVGLTTNANLLSPGVIEDLLDAGLDVMYASLLSADETRHREITGGKELKPVMENLARWAEARRPALATYLTTVLFEGNAGEQESLRSLARELNFIPLFRPLHSRGGALYVPAKRGEGACGIFAKVTFIAWDGSVLPCCNDTAGREVLGHVDTRSFEEIRAEKRRRILDGGMFQRCPACDDAYRTDLLRPGALETTRKMDVREGRRRLSP
jgi:MoaA/NifB/PqqE/SkfB family radical SAM enzyme